MNTETTAMTLIAYSGEARTMAFEALKKARSHAFGEAKKLLNKAETVSLKAHKAQTELLTAEANGDKPEIGVLLIHSQDHLMTSLLAQELIKEILYLHEEKADRKDIEQ